MGEMRTHKVKHVLVEDHIPIQVFWPSARLLPPLGYNLLVKHLALPLRLVGDVADKRHHTLFTHRDPIAKPLAQERRRGRGVHVFVYGHPEAGDAEGRSLGGFGAWRHVEDCHKAFGSCWDAQWLWIVGQLRNIVGFK